MIRKLLCVLPLFVPASALADQVTKPVTLKKQLADITKPATNLQRYLGNLSEPERIHLAACYAQSHTKFWHSSFRVGLVGIVWKPTIRVIKILDDNHAIVDMGALPVIFEDPDIARMQEGNEFTEK